MWEIASSPIVDKVFVLPIHDNLNTDFFRSLYKELCISVLGTDASNPLLQEYVREMASIGGKVISEIRWQYGSNKEWSSTQMYDLQNDPRFRLIHPNGWQDILDKAAEINQHALQTGYLRDYPDGTN
ncbi:MAG TPA: hypothetical protein VG895_00940 [Patescibacteria group bacterium]|nr:hypothetical protein [Patescibacteria group bacterium]